MNKVEILIISAAGGNPTIIEVISHPRTRREYERRGLELMEIGKDAGVEQSGSLVFSNDGSNPHFEMSGGEFCGNAARSAALLIAQHTGSSRVCFTMSGVKDPVRGTISGSEVCCEFPNLGSSIQKENISDPDGYIVDLGGIVHVVVFGLFPSEEYRKRHREIRDAFRLRERNAVGVVWAEKRKEGSIAIHPVVWVRAIDTLFYETSCGSGSIAVVYAVGADSLAVIQPSGKEIFVEQNRQSVKLTSAMEVISHVYGNQNSL